MSGFLFLLVIDWVMRRSVEGVRTGIRWRMTTVLGDFAHDSSTLTHTQTKIDRQKQKWEGNGLKN